MNKTFLYLLFLLFSAPVHAAADSYRWFHVSIDQVWGIFVFLLPMVLFPAILMAILYWKFTFKKKNENSANSISKEN